MLYISQYNYCSIPGMSRGLIEYDSLPFPPMYKKRQAELWITRLTGQVSARPFIFEDPNVVFIPRGNFYNISSCN